MAIDPLEDDVAHANRRDALKFQAKAAQEEDEERKSFAPSDDEQHEFFNKALRGAGGGLAATDIDEEALPQSMGIAERHQSNMSSLHESTLEILTGNIKKLHLDQKQRDTINKKYVFSPYL